MKFSLVVATCCYLVSSALATSLQGDGQSNQPSLTSLVLMNADTNQEIQEIEDGAVITVPAGTPLNVQAIVDGDTKGAKVRFYDNGKVSRTERAKPYAFCGDLSGDYNSCSSLVPGPIKITAEVIKDGYSIDSITASFTLKEYEVGIKFYLMNAETDEELYELTNGAAIDLCLVGYHLNV